MIDAPNTQGQKCLVGIVQWAPVTSVSEDISDIFHNDNSDNFARNDIEKSRVHCVFTCKVCFVVIMIALSSTNNDLMIVILKDMPEIHYV